MNPFKYIWLFIEFIYQAIIHEYQDRKNQEVLDELFETLNTEQDEAIMGKIKGARGTIAKGGSDEDWQYPRDTKDRWFNQN